MLVPSNKPLASHWSHFVFLLASAPHSSGHQSQVNPWGCFWGKSLLFLFLLKFDLANYSKHHKMCFIWNSPANAFLSPKIFFFAASLPHSFLLMILSKTVSYSKTWSIWIYGGILKLCPSPDWLFSLPIDDPTHDYWQPFNTCTVHIIKYLIITHIQLPHSPLFASSLPFAISAAQTCNLSFSIFELLNLSNSQIDNDVFYIFIFMPTQLLVLDNQTNHVHLMTYLQYDGDQFADKSHAWVLNKLLKLANWANHPKNS